MIPDREKVIKGLEICTTSGMCRDCPYGKTCAADSQELMENALALLNTPDVVPLPTDDGHLCCEACGCEIKHGQSHCVKCGRIIDWRK